MADIKSSDLVAAFRAARNQVQVQQESDRPYKKGLTEKDRRRAASSDKYKSFRDKYDTYPESCETFTTQDLMYLFREKANEVGVKYVISNMKRDMGIFKRMKEDYTVPEICLMIEFIFTSDQDYLDKSITQPTVLVSRWNSTIYRDALDWSKGEYTNRRREKKSTSVREWKEEVKGTKVKIGEWD